MLRKAEVVLFAAPTSFNVIGTRMMPAIANNTITRPARVNRREWIVRLIKPLFSRSL